MALGLDDLTDVDARAPTAMASLMASSSRGGLVRSTGVPNQLRSSVRPSSVIA